MRTRTKFATTAATATALAAGSALLATGADFSPRGDNEKLEKPSSIAVIFHADWCGTCERMAPSVMETKEHAMTNDTSALFVKLDFTDDKTSQQAKYMLASLGMNEAWAEHGGKTGFVLLVDPETGEVQDRLTADMDSSQMQRTVARAAR